MTSSSFYQSKPDLNEMQKFATNKYLINSINTLKNGTYNQIDNKCLLEKFERLMNSVSNLIRI